MSPAELAAIPVTIASGTPKPIFQSAAVTTVITAEQIKSLGAIELHEVLETVPGVHVSLQGSTYDYNYTMRGIRNPTNSQVLMLLNGTRISTPFRGTIPFFTEFPIDAIQRVEVIRGPGSALYGADAFAGVINIITKSAKDLKGLTLGGRTGNQGSQGGWGQYGHEWAGWNVGASLQYQYTDGDTGRVVNRDNQSRYDDAIGTNVSNAPGAMNTRYETVNGHFSLQREHWDIGLWAFNAIDAGVRLGGAGALDPSGFANNAIYLGDVRYSTENLLENWELQAHASYFYTEILGQFKLFPNNARLPIRADGNLSTSLDNATLIAFPDGVKANVGRTEQIPALELSSIYKGWQGNLLRLSTGFRYEETLPNESKNYGPGVIQGSPSAVGGQLTDVTGTPYMYLANTHRTVWSLVAQDEWQFAKDWQLTAGVRYDDYSDFGNTVNPRAALVWDINRQLTSKLLYGKAFRAPTFSEQGNQNNPVLLGNSQLKPETIHTYEWAFDYRPLSSLRTGINLYYYQIEDLIGVIDSTFQNSGNQEGYGGEFEWNWQIAEQWKAMGNYAWQHATNEQTRQQVAGVPEHHVFFALQWQFMPNWQIQPQINWVGGRINTLQANGPLNDYETVDLTLRGKKLFGHLNLAASLRNMSDTHYTEPAYAPIGQNLPMSVRSFYFEASINF